VGSHAEIDYNIKDMNPIVYSRNIVLKWNAWINEACMFYPVYLWYCILLFW